jgi:NAD(P)-dependent dehydrogenase (short-subunit alcohol dehydrogenase family)
MRRQRIALGLLAAGGIGAVAASRAIRARRATTFSGKVVLIVGGSRGLGLELARLFAGERAHLALVARDGEALARAQTELAEHGARVLLLPADIRDRAQVERAVQRTVNHYGRLDVLVNLAGIIQAGPLEDMTIEDFEQTMAVHFWGPLYAIRAALPHLRRSASPRIVNVSSIGGKVAVPHLGPYSASKFALVGLSDAFRAELAAEGIPVTTVCPGLMRTGSFINAAFKGQHEKEFAWFSVSDSLPLFSIDARRAARQIVDACRHGDPELIITVQAKLLARIASLAPNTVGRAMALASGLLPGPGGREGTSPRLGREMRPHWLTQLLQTFSHEAIARNNEAPGALPIHAGAKRG